MSLHSLQESASWAKLSGGSGLTDVATSLPHRCSIGLRSGLTRPVKDIHIISTWVVRISLMYFSAFRVLLILTSADQPIMEMAPPAITLHADTPSMLTAFLCIAFWIVLTTSSVHMDSSIMAMERKSCFIPEPNMPPSKCRSLTMLSCPLQLQPSVLQS